MTSSQMTKPGLRAEGFARRDGLEPAFRAAASRRIAERALALPELQAGGIVAGYWPIRSEVDPRPLLEALDARGVPLALPVVAHPTLLFRRWRPGELLAKSSFGTFEPSEHAPAVTPAILLMPLARFDRAGNRIGYGKGHYDRAIAAIEGADDAGAARVRDVRLLAVGLAFAVQEAHTIPVEPHDRPLDLVVTEADTIRPTRKSA